MIKPKDAIHISVEYSTEDEEYGPVYVATCEEIAVVTDGKTLDELLANLREAISVHLQDTDTVKQFGITPNPRLIITLELPEESSASAFEEYLGERASRGSQAKFKRVMAKVADVEPRDEDRFDG